MLRAKRKHLSSSAPALLARRYKGSDTASDMDRREAFKMKMRQHYTGDFLRAKHAPPPSPRLHLLLQYTKHYKTAFSVGAR